MGNNFLSHISGKNATTLSLRALAVFKWNFLLAAQSPYEPFVEVPVTKELGDGFCRKWKDFKDWLIIVRIDTDCSPDLPWGHPLPALWMRIKPFAQDIYNEYFSAFLHVLLWKHWHDNLHFQSTVSRRKASGLKDDHLQQFKELLQAI